MITAHSACPCQGTSRAEAGISTALTEQEWQTATLSELRRRSRLTLTRTDYFNRDNSPGLFSSGEFYRSVKGMQTAFAGVEPRTQSRAAIGITPVPCLCAVCISLIPDTERYENQRRALPDFHEKLRYLFHVVVPEIKHADRLEIH